MRRISKKELLSIPNLMGYFRLIMIPVFVWLYLKASTDADYYRAAIVMGIQHFHQGHLRFHAALEGILDGSGIKIPLALQKGIEGGIDVKQQLVDFRICLHRLPALAVQPAFTGIPQPGSAGELAAELRHRPVHGDASHYRSFARLVQSALFEVEQNLEFFYFHTLITLVAKLPVL